MRRKSSSSVKIRYPRYNREELIKELRKKFTEIADRYKISRVILFGSYAKGNYTASSDIDVLVIHEMRNIDLYKEIRKLIDIKGLELHLYHKDEYIHIKDRIDRMIKGGIEIYP